jgi:hypothetical protein
MIKIVINKDNKEKSLASFKKAVFFFLNKYRERLYFSKKKKNK